MKAITTGLLKSRISRWSMLAGLAALLVWAWPALAGVKHAVEAVAIYLSLDPGEARATPSGNVHVKDMGAVCMMVSENPLFAGRLTWTGNFEGDAQMNGAGSGTGVFEVGTWDLSSDVPVFIPSSTGGRWVTKWEARGSLSGLGYVGKVVGHGIAGEVEGMQFDVELVGGITGADYYSGQLLNPQAEK
jgi:hypothetical protein